MARYKLLIKASAIKELQSISTKRDRQRIVRKIEALAENPFPVGSQKLSARERYRVRQGNYRIIYSVVENELVVWVVKIGHRKNVHN